jgi:predicted acyltransferase (DUF342 family)
MDREKTLRYGLIALSILIALVGAYFGIRLPYPELPAVPAQDVTALEGRVTRLETDMDALLLGGGGTGGAESFSIGAAGKTNVAWLIANQVTGKNLIESQGDLTVADDATITDDAAVGGDLAVTGALSAGSYSGAASTLTGLTVNGNAQITGALAVSGTTNLVGNISSSTGAVTVTDDLYVTGAMQIIGAISNPTHYITIADHVDIQNTLNYGAANLWPLGAEDSNFQFS